jgi:hypothetical protein
VNDCAKMLQGHLHKLSKSKYAATNKLKTMKMQVM